jgi:pimeloyl-ACP methyl ester carboxylesterase
MPAEVNVLSNASGGKPPLIDFGLKRFKDGSGDCAVVFIHGILSDGDQCWKHKNGTYWPKLLASSDQSRILSIFVYTYESDIFSADYNLDDVVDDLRQRLRNAKVEDFPRILFVCHSMGGLVARRYLVRRQLDIATAETRTIFGLLLVASPSLGADWANWLTPIAQFFQHSQADALRFSKNNRWLDTLDRDFRDLKESGKLQLRGRELIEDKFIVLHKFFFFPKVVERISGARYFGEALKIAGSDHFSIAKPRDADALQHIVLCELIDTVMHVEGEGPVLQRPTVLSLERLIEIASGLSANQKKLLTRVSKSEDGVYVGHLMSDLQWSRPEVVYRGRDLQSLGLIEIKDLTDQLFVLSKIVKKLIGLHREVVVNIIQSNEGAPE